MLGIARPCVYILCTLHVFKQALLIAPGVQNMEGGDAQALVAAEKAAMLEWAILPSIKKFYEGPDFLAKCKQVAADLGLPAREWPRVQLPCTLSLDWATIHPHGRKSCVAPRLPSAELKRIKTEAIKEQFELEFPPDLPAHEQPTRNPTDLRAAGLRDHLTPEEQAVQDHEKQLRLNAFKRDQEVQKVQQKLDAALQKYEEEHKEDWWLRQLWDLSTWHPACLCVLPEQWMPLAKVSGDLHSPVEHMVGTVKHEVHEMMLDMDLNSPDLKLGRTYQDMILKAVAERGNGERGSKHIQGSVRKLPCICKILAAEKGQIVTLHYEFSDLRAKVHRVPGTAGAWIRDTKWT